MTLRGIVLSAALALGGCGELGGARSPADVFFPVHHESDSPAAVVGGTLTEESGCLFAQTSASRHLVLWPEGFSYGGGEVKDADGNVVASVGQLFRAGGGEFEQPVAEELVGPIPAECQTNKYVFVGEML